MSLLGRLFGLGRTENSKDNAPMITISHEIDDIEGAVRCIPGYNELVIAEKNTYGLINKNINGKTEAKDALKKINEIFTYIDKEVAPKLVRYKMHSALFCFDRTTYLFRELKLIGDLGKEESRLKKIIEQESLENN